MPFGKDKTTIAYILSATPHIMNTTDLRRRNLRQWIADKYGGQQTRFAEAIAINQGELSALLKNKSFGEKKARKIEQAAQMPAMWLDQEHAIAQSDHQERRTMPHISSIPEILTDIKAGKMVIITDAEDRENEGDIIFAAEHATPELMGFMIRYTSGVVCAPLSNKRADEMNLPPMVTNNEDPKGTAYTVSCDAASGVSTGISAADRARTVQILADASSTPADITRPGHIFPLRAVDGGVAERPGHTEAAVELSLAAGLSGVGVIAEVVHDDGSMMRFDALRAFATEHNLPMISIEDLIKYVAKA